MRFRDIMRSGDLDKLTIWLDTFVIAVPERQTILLRDAAYTEGAIAVPGQTNYYCDNKILTLAENGSLILGFPNGQFLQTKPNLFVGPLVILKLCVMIAGTYKTRLGVSSFQSAMFQWPVDPLDHQWIKGPIAFDVDESQWIPPNTTIAAVYGMRRLTTQTPSGTMTFAPGALECDPVRQ